MVKTKYVTVSKKAISMILAVVMIMAVLPLSVFASNYTTQGADLKVYMTTPSEVEYDALKSNDEYYYNKIDTPFDPGSDLEFKIAFGGASGINNMQLSALEGKIGVYSDVAGSNEVAASTDFTMLKVNNTVWPDNSIKFKRTGFSVTMSLPGGKLDVGKTYYLILNDISSSGNQGTGNIGKKIVFEFTTSLVSEVKLDVDKLIFDGVGQKYTLTPTISPATAIDKEVSFVSTNNSVATVDDNGVITSVSEGTASIVVVTNDGKKTDTCNIAVKDTPNNRVLKPVSGMQSLDVSNLGYEITTPNVFKDVTTGYNVIADSVKLGEVPSITFSFASNGGNNSAFHVKVYDNASFENPIDTQEYVESTEFTYVPNQTLFRTGITYYLVIDKTSLTGTDVITKDVVVSFTVDGTADATVGTPTYLLINKENVEIGIGFTEELSAITEAGLMAATDYVWTSSNKDVATVKDGVVTAKANGKTTITVASKDGRFTDTCEVTASTISVKDIAINEGLSIDITKGTPVTLSATITPYNATNKDVVWSSSNEDVATVSNEGTVTIANGATQGQTAVITVKSVDGNFTDNITVTVFSDSPKKDDDGFYQVYTPEQLIWVKDKASSDANDPCNVKLMKNIDLSKSANWSGFLEYKGIFDGNNYSVNINLKKYANVVGVGSQAGGLFNKLSGATVKNLKITGLMVAYSQVGGLCYQASDSTITNVINYADVAITGVNQVAGIAAQVIGTSVIRNCANYGKIDGFGGNGEAAGIAARIQGAAVVLNCYNQGDISSIWDQGTGGIVALMLANNATTNHPAVMNCYNTGKVVTLATTQNRLGPIVGWVNGTFGTVSNCYYLDSSAKEGSNSTAIIPGSAIAKSSSYMKTTDFVTDLTGSGSTVNRAYVYKEADYPVFRWVAGDTATLKGITATTPTKTYYDVRESIDIAGMIVLAHYDDGTTEALLTSDFTYTPNGYPDVKDTMISIKYKDKETSIGINVSKYPLTDLVIKENPSKTTYEGTGDEDVDLSGLTLTAIFEKDGRSVSVDLTSGFTAKVDKIDDKMTSIPVEYTYEGITKTVDVQILNKSNMQLDKVAYCTDSLPSPFILKSGDTVDISKVKLDLTYVSGTKTFSQTVTSGFTVYPAVIKDDTTTLTFSYAHDGLTKSVEVPMVNLSNLDYESLTVENYPNSSASNEYVYKIGDTPDLTGLVLTVNCKCGDLAYTYTVDKGYEVLGPKKIAADTKHITVAYTVDKVTRTVDIPVLVSQECDHDFDKEVVSADALRSEATTAYPATYWYTCSRCGAVSDTKYFEYGEKLPYEIIKGENGIFTDDGKTALSFTCNGLFSNFTGVKIDGVLVDPDNYIAVSGSTIITFTDEYKKSLSAGDHTLTVLYTDAQVDAEFTIKKAQTSTKTETVDKTETKNNEKVANTNDNTAIAGIATVCVLSLGAASTVGYKRKKEVEG